MSSDAPFVPRVPTLEHVEGLTPPQRAVLETRYGVRDEAGLAWALRTNRVRDTEELGPDVQRALRRVLRGHCWTGPWRPLAHARETAERVLGWLQQSEDALRLVVVGGVRRMDPWVDGVDLLATAHDPDALRAAFENLGMVDEVVEPGTVRLKDGTRVTLTVCEEDPAVFFAQLAERAAPWPPALDDPDTVVMAQVRGLSHVHTNHAAGSHGARDLVRESMREGYAWLWVVDRGPSARPKGVSTEAFDDWLADLATATSAVRAEVQAEAAQDEPAPVVPHVFSGLEVGVDANGALDAADAMLAEVDGAVGVVGNDAQPLTGEVATQQALTLIAHPRIRALAHPRHEGLGGAGAQFDMDRIAPALAAEGVAFCVSGEPAAAPLPAAWHETLRRHEVPVLPVAEAHDLRGLDQALGAVGLLRAQGYRMSEVLGTLEVEGMRAFLAGGTA